MVTSPQDDAATLAMLKDMCPYHGRIWRAWDDLGRKGNRSGAGAVRLLHAPDGAGTMSSHPTPGTWIAKARATGGYNIVAVDDVLEDIVIGTAALNDHSLETAHANAQVLAAAHELLDAAKLLESAEDAHANCEECEGEGVPELCEKCFPLFDDARVSRRLAIKKAGG